MVKQHPFSSGNPAKVSGAEARQEQDLLF